MTTTPTQRASSDSTSCSRSQKPEVIGGRYELVGELGKGGMGVVWLARDQELNTKVALKFLREEMTSEADALLQSWEGRGHPSTATFRTRTHHQDVRFRDQRHRGRHLDGVRQRHQPPQAEDAEAGEVLRGGASIKALGS